MSASLGQRGARPAGRREAVICDVDGTLCDVRAVRRFVEAPSDDRPFRPDFHRFHWESQHSPAHEAVVSAVQRLRASGLALVVVSGREARWFDLTATWLARHGVAYDALTLRPSRDYRPDSVIKAEMLASLETRFQPRLAIDDRIETIRVWESAGIPTVHVTDDGRLSPINWPAGLEEDPRLAAHLSGIV